MTSKHRMLMVCSMVEMKKHENHHSTDKQYFQWKSWILIEDTKGKKTIFRNLDFPHIKSIFKKWVKNTSLFVVLAFKILDTEKVTFLKGEKNGFFIYGPQVWLELCSNLKFFSSFFYDRFFLRFFLQQVFFKVFFTAGFF